MSQFEYQQKAKIPRIDVDEFDYDFDDCDWQDDTEFYEEAMKSGMKLLNFRNKQTVPGEDTTHSEATLGFN